MKSISFLFALMLLFAAPIASAQSGKIKTSPILKIETFQIKDWNREVVTVINGDILTERNKPSKRFTNQNQIVFQGNNRAKGWIIAILVGNNREGIVLKGCDAPNCKVSAQRVVASNQHELQTMATADIIALSDQQNQQNLNIQTTNTATKTDVLKTDKANTMQKVNTPNSNINLNKTNAKVIRQ